MRITLLLALTFAELAAGVSVFEEGDTCGVTSSDFFKSDFGGDYRVSGSAGCDLSSESKGCYCAVDYEDSARLSEWKWQCNGAVKFGPANGKTCPETVPVPPSLQLVGDSSSVLTSPATCDLDIHPGGQRDDPVCAYSDCETGGSSSSVCGCVNRTKYGLGEGVEWFCMHSTCNCEPIEESTTVIAPSAGDETMNSTVFDDLDPTVFSEWEKCGVKSADFFNPDFGGNYMVAGTKGCDLSADKKNCFCAVDYNDTERLSEWKWQCNGSVQFGPAEGKTCPASVPVPKATESVTNQLAVLAAVECDPLVHPTGQRGDPVCGYSSCDVGGDSSSICGCVNLTKYGMGNGTRWFCMHSECNCAPVTAKADAGTDSAPENTTVSTTSDAAVPVVVAGVTLISGMFALLMNFL